jgi:hypothetical protein
MNVLLEAIQSWFRSSSHATAIAGGLWIGEVREQTVMPYCVMALGTGDDLRDSEVELNEVEIDFQLYAREGAAALSLVTAMTDGLRRELGKLGLAGTTQLVSVDRQGKPMLLPNSRDVIQANQTLVFRLQTARID